MIYYSDGLGFLFDNLDKFSALSNEVAVALIQAESNYHQKILDNLNKFPDFEFNNDLAEALLYSGEDLAIKFLVNYLNLFSSLSNDIFLELVKINKNYHNILLNNLEKFIDLDFDERFFNELLLANKDERENVIIFVLNNINLFNLDQEYIFLKLIKLDKEYHNLILQYIDKLGVFDWDNKLAEKLLDDNNGKIFILQNLARFKSLKDDIVIELLKLDPLLKHNYLEKIFENLDVFESLNRNSDFLLFLLKSYNNTTYVQKKVRGLIINNLFRFQNLSNEIALDLIQLTTDSHEIIKENLQIFPNLKFNQNVLIELSYNTNGLIFIINNLELFTDFNRDSLFILLLSHVLLDVELLVKKTRLFNIHYDADFWDNLIKEATFSISKTNIINFIKFNIDILDDLNHNLVKFLIRNGEGKFLFKYKNKFKHLAFNEVFLEDLFKIEDFKEKENVADFVIQHLFLFSHLDNEVLQNIKSILRSRYASLIINYYREHGKNIQFNLDFAKFLLKIENKDFLIENLEYFHNLSQNIFLSLFEEYNRYDRSYKEAKFFKKVEKLEYIFNKQIDVFNITFDNALASQLIKIKPEGQEFLLRNLFRFKKLSKNLFVDLINLSNRKVVNNNVNIFEIVLENLSAFSISEYFTVFIFDNELALNLLKTSKGTKFFIGNIDKFEDLKVEIANILFENDMEAIVMEHLDCFENLHFNLDMAVKYIKLDPKYHQIILNNLRHFEGLVFDQSLKDALLKDDTNGYGAKFLKDNIEKFYFKDE